jgi:uncharacterized protein
MRRMGELSLLILQPTPFCNIDCRYCYLPHRSDKTRISDQTLEAVLRNVFASQCLGKQLTIIWHAGEPLAVEIGFYEKAIALARRLSPPVLEIRHALQTNGLLIDRKWIEFFRAHDFNVGVSLDGPKAIHDANRVFRNGAGSFDGAMAGVRLLQQQGFPFYVVSVLNLHNLDRPDEMFEFYDANDLRAVCFNIEESDGVNTSAALQRADVVTAFRAFFARFVERVGQSEKRWAVRELDGMTRKILQPAQAKVRNEQVEPFAIVTIGHNGDFTTFSPEFLGAKDARHGDFVIGNLAKGPIEQAESSPVFRLLDEEIRAGVSKCARECQYFRVCGGGAPANKHGELGTMDAATTKFCECMVKATADIVLQQLETRVHP